MESNSIVQLYAYDVTNGMCEQMSQEILGRCIEGVWHTSVVVFDREFFYDSSGIQSCVPGATVLGKPTKVENIGDTSKSYETFMDYLKQIGDNEFRGENFNFLKHNCNTFSQEMCKYLCDKNLPDYILNLRNEVLSSPQGQFLAWMIDSMTDTAKQSGVNVYIRKSLYLKSVPMTNRKLLFKTKSTK